MKLDGFRIFVEDIGIMIRFYRDVLGFEIKENEESSNVFLEKDGTLFLLCGRRDLEKMTAREFYYADRPSGHFEIALSVDDYWAVDKTYKTAVSKGTVPVMPPAAQPWRQRTCYIADPEGNLVEIGSFNKGDSGL